MSSETRRRTDENGGAPTPTAHKNPVGLPNAGAEGKLSGISLPADHQGEQGQNRSCSIERGVSHCYECKEICRKGLLAKRKPFGFTEFARRYGVEVLLDCLEINEQTGVVYHRQGLVGDYDDFENLEDLIDFIKTGRMFV